MLSYPGKAIVMSAQLQPPIKVRVGAVQFHPYGDQLDFVWLSARTPHVALSTRGEPKQIQFDFAWLSARTPHGMYAW